MLIYIIIGVIQQILFQLIIPQKEMAEAVKYGESLFNKNIMIGVAIAVFCFGVLMWPLFVSGEIYKRLTGKDFLKLDK